MTAIAGYTNGTNFAIAGDSGAFDEAQSLKMTMATPKIWATKNTLQGGAGNARVIELGRSAGIEDPHKLASVLLEANIAGEWSVMVVTREGIYEIGDDGSVFKFKERYCAIGAGGPIALGALAVLTTLDTPPAAAVKNALTVTARHSTLCSTPISVLSK